MRSITPIVSARRTRRLVERRARRRPALVAAGVGAAVLTMVGLSGTLPISEAEASAPAFTLASYTTAALPAALVRGSSAGPASIVTTEAQSALDAGNAAVAAASTVTTDISASGLDIGVADASVDTTALQDSVDRLETAIDSLPELLLPDVTDEVTALTDAVGARVSSLRGSLDAAIAVKAQQEAEAAARAEAEAAAAAEARASASSLPTAAIPAGVATGDNSPAGAQAYAYSRLASYGWGDDQFGCLVALWDRESGWNYQAYNAGSGAAGIPQALPGSKMASAGADWQYSAATQVNWGLGYIAGRYGTPCGAWAQSESVGWY